MQEAIGKHTLESCAYLAQTMLSQSCTGLSPMPDHHETHFPSMPPGLSLMQGHFGYGPHLPPLSPHPPPPHPGQHPTTPEQAVVSSSGIPYTPQQSPVKQQQPDFRAGQITGSPMRGGPIPGGECPSPARSAYGSSPARSHGYPGTPSKDGYILPSPAKQLFPADGAQQAAPSGYQPQYGGSQHYDHQVDHSHHIQGDGSYGYDHHHHQNAGQSGAYGNQYGSLV